METLLKPLHELKSKLADVAKDLHSLERLLAVDVASSLNKIRFITEKVLLRLCTSRGVSWGTGEPTLERMIGPLIAAGVIPKNVALHVRTVQTYSSPGSHFQQSELSGSHVQIAQFALVEFLAWYHEAPESRLPVPAEEETPEASPNLEALTGTISRALWQRTRPGVIECSGTVECFTQNAHVWLVVEVGSLLWPKEPEVKSDAAGAWSGSYCEGGSTTRLNLGLWVVDDAINKRIHEWLETGHRTGSYPGLTPSPGMRRIATFENLELA